MSLVLELVIRALLRSLDLEIKRVYSPIMTVSIFTFGDTQCIALHTISIKSDLEMETSDEMSLRNSETGRILRAITSKVAVLQPKGSYLPNERGRGRSTG